MTSEEMNRAIEFILQHEAQVSIHLEDVANHLEDLAKYEKRDHGLLAQMAVQDQRISELLEIQSRRLDRAETRHEQLMEEFRAGFGRIVAKLSEKPDS